MVGSLTDTELHFDGGGGVLVGAAIIKDELVDQ